MAELIGDAEIRVDMDTDDALRSLEQFTRDADGRLRDLRGRFASEGSRIGTSLGEASREGGRLGGVLRGLSSAVGTVGGIAASFGKIAATAGAAVPLLAGVAAAVESIAPAAGVAATGLFAVQLASNAVKIGMIGVEDAVGAALDPSDPEAYAEALKKLSPNAKAFVEQLHSMQPALDELRKGVQDQLFKGFDKVLSDLGKSTLPVLRGGLEQAAGSLNAMARNVANAAIGLSDNGTLGKAVKGANAGLSNLSRIPGQVATAFTQVAAAAAPSFDRLTAAAARTFDQLSVKVGNAFKSGAIEGAIEGAIAVLKDLASVAGNAFSIVRSIFSAAQVSGGGFVGTLKEITGALATAFASPAVQSGLRSIFQTMATVAQTAAPLLGRALRLIAPILTALGPPIQRLITSLGGALSPIIAGLGPVLGAAARVVSVLVDAIAPLLPIVGRLAASLLPVLTPLLTAVGDVIAQLAPVVQVLVQALAAALAPILAQLPALVQPFATLLSTLAATVLPVVAQLIVTLAPVITRLAAAFGQVLAAVAPLLAAIGSLAAQLVSALMPVLQPIITLIGRVASVLATLLAGAITNVVVPAIRVIAALLSGDFGRAWEIAKAAVSRAATVIANVARRIGEWIKQGVEAAVRWFAALPGRAASALSGLAGRLASVASGAFQRFRSAAADKVSALLGWVRGIPGRIRGALGNLGSLLVSAGRAVIQGMISGVKNAAGALVSATKGVVSNAIQGAKNLLGISSPSRVFAKIGRDTGRGFIIGLTGTREQIKRTATNIVGAITSAFRGRNTRLDDRLVQLVKDGNKRLQGLAKERDALARRISEAEKFAADVTQRARAGASLSSIAPESANPRELEANLANSLKAIQAFGKNITKLQRKGLSKDLIRQLLELGPEQGGALAANLADQGGNYIRRINDLQSKIAKSTKSLGQNGADILFDAGKKAGKGFLTGLKAQRKDIEALMLDIAKSIQKSIRKALGIRSPSRVMAEVGRQSGLGVVQGLSESAPLVTRAMAQIARRISDGVGEPVAPVRAPAVGGVGLVAGAVRPAPVAATVEVTFINRGVIGSEADLLNWLRKSMTTLQRQGRLPIASGR